MVKVKAQLKLLQNEIESRLFIKISNAAIQLPNKRTKCSQENKIVEIRDWEVGFSVTRYEISLWNSEKPFISTHKGVPNVTF